MDGAVQWMRCNIGDGNIPNDLLLVRIEEPVEVVVIDVVADGQLVNNRIG